MFRSSASLLERFVVSFPKLRFLFVFCSLVFFFQRNKMSFCNFHLQEQFGLSRDEGFSAASPEKRKRERESVDASDKIISTNQKLLFARDKFET